ncbi:MAG TPA: hypothetical protein VH478_01125 [Trebonia sp.]|jgi:hypothetical protein|nr:hypothetical protein [Trebonia sp.]
MTGELMKGYFALVNDVQGASARETDRECLQRAVGDDPLAVQADAPEQLRKQVARLIGKAWWRLEQIGWLTGRSARTPGETGIVVSHSSGYAQFSASATNRHAGLAHSGPPGVRRHRQAEFRSLASTDNIRQEVIHD